MSGLSQPAPSGARNVDAESWRDRSQRIGGIQAAADLAFVLLLVVALFWLIREGHGNRFFYDEWGWVESRRSGLSAILDSYNQHMEIVPLAVYELMFHTVGLNHYHWYRLLATVGHLALVTAVYGFARSRIGPLALFVAVPLAFLGSGWEDILWGINFGFTTSIALGIAALIWLESDSRPNAVGCALLVVSLLFSETAVLFAIGLAFELSWRDRSLRRIWVWGLPIVLYVVWYIGFYTAYEPEHDIGAIPTFGAQLAANASGGLFGERAGVGWVVLGLIAVLLIWRLVRGSAWGPRFLAVLLTVLGYWTLVAVGRSQLGDPGASRYVYSGAVLLLLVVLDSLRGLKVDWRSALILLVLGTLALIGGLNAFTDGEGELYEGSTSEAAQLTALELIKGFIPPALALDPHWSPQIDAAAYLPAARDLHSTGAFTLAQLLQQGEEQRASADLTLVRGGELTVASRVSPEPAGAIAPTVELRLGGRLSRTRGCVRYVPSGSGSTLDLTLPPGGLTLQVRAQAAGTQHPPTQIFARRFASSYENAPVASFRNAQTLLIRARRDAAPEPWHVRLSPWETVTACTVGA